jgi:hypothetical protein
MKADVARIIAEHRAACGGSIIMFCLAIASIFLVAFIIAGLR